VLATGKPGGMQGSKKKSAREKGGKKRLSLNKSFPYASRGGAGAEGPVNKLKENKWESSWGIASKDGLRKHAGKQSEGGENGKRLGIFVQRRGLLENFLRRNFSQEGVSEGRTGGLEGGEKENKVFASRQPRIKSLVEKCAVSFFGLMADLKKKNGFLSR